MQEDNENKFYELVKAIRDFLRPLNSQHTYYSDIPSNHKE